MLGFELFAIACLDDLDIIENLGELGGDIGIFFLQGASVFFHLADNHIDRYERKRDHNKPDNREFGALVKHHANKPNNRAKLADKLRNVVRDCHTDNANIVGNARH